MYYKFILIGILLLVSFFPAYLGYQAQHAWVGYIFTIAFALSAYVPYLRDHGKRWWIALVLLAVFGYSIESVGVLTCFPYGCFAYSDQLWPKIFDIVPRILAFTRPPLVVWIWHQTLRLRHLSPATRIHSWQGGKEKVWRKSRIVWWMGLVLVDLVLDPIAVMMGLWSYPWWWFRFGVPLSNFAGWMLSGTIGIMILSEITKANTTIKQPWNYSYGLRCTMAFFIGYAIWRIVIQYYTM